MIDSVAGVLTSVQMKDTVEQGFAPVRYNPVCTSRAGRVRPKHDYDKDGVCYFCDAKEPEDGAAPR